MWTCIKFVPVNGAKPNLPVYQTKQSACADVEAHFHNDKKVKVFNSLANTSFDKVAGKIALVDEERDGLMIYPGERVMIPTGWRMLIPFGWHVAVNPRSGLSLKLGLCVLNAPGTIDADYTDEVFVLLTNTSQVAVPVYEGDRIAQLEIVKNATKEAYFVLGTEEELLAHKAESNRIGGMGSTGVHTK